MTWQPIETAPRDGSSILLCHWEDGYCLVGEWWVQGWWSTGPFKYSPIGTEVRNPIFIDFEPTHWMPLPPPPTEQTSDSNRPHLESGAVAKSES